MKELVIHESSLAHLTDIMDQAKNYVQSSKAPSTKKAYSSDWNHFKDWCIKNHVNFLPAEPETVALYLTFGANKGYKASTLQRRISAISQAHKTAGYELPPTHHHIVNTVWNGIKRDIGTAQKGKIPIMVDDIRLMMNVLPDNLLGIRDRALLLLGFAGAFRRSELVGLNVEDLEFVKEGIKVIVRKSKTDQEGQGMLKGIPFGSHFETCPVRAVQEWLNASELAEGPLFKSINRHGQIQEGRLSDKTVALVIKKYVAKAGLNPDNYSGHSLRAGLATSAAEAGVSERSIMNQTGHKSVNMVRRYIREGSLFRNNAAAYVGL